MSVREILSTLLRRWWLVLAPALLIVAATVAFTPPAPALSYAVTMRFAAGLPPEPRASGVYNYDQHYNWLASEYITRALAQAVETSEFARNLSTRLAGQNIVVPVGAIRSEYLASYMKVTVVWPNDAEAVLVANALVAELSENSDAYWPQLTGATASPVRLLDKPVAVALPPPLRSRFDLPVRAALGLAAGVALAFAWRFLDPFLRRREDIEHRGMHVLAEVK
jgi:capsular polysaccharide biosynthesis protein